MDIKWEIKEYKSIVNEIKQLEKDLKELKIHKKDQEDKILQYLNETEKEDIVFEDISFFKKEVFKRKRKNKLSKLKTCSDILKSAGIKDCEDLSSKILESLKGEVDKKFVLKNKNLK